MSKIIVNRENFKIDEIELNQGTLSIGRNKDRDLTIDDRTVSNHHANIVTVFSSTYIEDQGSTNGTFVNGKQTNTHTLHNGDVVTIGHYQLLFQSKATDNPVHPINATQILDQGQVAALLEKAHQRSKEKKQEQEQEQGQGQKTHATSPPAARINIRRKILAGSKPAPEYGIPSTHDDKPDIDTSGSLQSEPHDQPSDEDRSVTSPFKSIVLMILAIGIIAGLLFAFYAL